MITLSTLAVLYSIIGLYIFKKRYGHFSLIDENMQLWTLLLAVCITASGAMAIAACINYLP